MKSQGFYYKIKLRESILKQIDERHIFDHLKSSNDTSSSAKYFYKNFHGKENKLNEKITIMHYLLHAGQSKEVFNLLREWPNKEKYFPWSIFFECLIKKNLQLNEAEFSEVNNHIKIQSTEISPSPNYANINSSFQKNLLEYIDQLKYTSDQFITLLWNKLKFIKDRNLVEQEAEIIEKLVKYDSRNPKLEEHLKSFKKRQALNSIINQNKDSIKIDFATYSHNTFTQEELNICQNILSFVTEKYPDGDSVYYNFSIMFYQMNAYQFSLLCLEKCSSNLNLNWLKIELLYLNNRFFECIDLCTQLFLNFPDNSEIQFASLYQKSQALWRIGNKTEAIEIMTSIINIRPSYRSAYETLQSWKETS